MHKTTRRAFLKSSAALAAGSAVLRDVHALGAPEIATTPLSQFDYKDVELFDGPMGLGPMDMPFPFPSGGKGSSPAEFIEEIHAMMEEYEINADDLFGPADDDDNSDNGWGAALDQLIILTKTM